jgi:hypothetical protein
MAFGEKSIRRKMKEKMPRELKNSLTVTRATLEEALLQYLAPLGTVLWTNKLSLEIPETINMKVSKKADGAQLSERKQVGKLTRTSKTTRSKEQSAA